MPDQPNTRCHLLTADRPPSTEKILPREPLLAKIAEDLRFYRFVFIHGKSGIGKTKLAELVFQARQGRYAFAAWYRHTGDFRKDFYLQISEHDLLVQLEAQIAFARQNDLGQDLIDRNCASICRQYWQENCPGPKLIVVDGVRDFEALSPWLPLLDLDEAHVLITTQTLPQQADPRFPYAVVDVPAFGPEELETMLQHFGQTLENRQLAGYLGESPLLLRLFLKNNTPAQPEKSAALVARLLRETPGDALDDRLILALLDFCDLPPAILWTLMQLAAMPDKFHDAGFIASILGLAGPEKPVYTQGYNIFKGKGRYRHATDEVVRLEDILDWLKTRGWLEFNVFDEVHCHASLVAPLRQFTEPRYDYFLEQGERLDLTFFLNENGYEEERLDAADLRLHRVSDGELEQHLGAFTQFLDDEQSELFQGLLVRYADLLESRIKWQEELPLRRKIADIRQKSDAYNSTEKLYAQGRLADCLGRNGLPAEALTIYLAALKMEEKDRSDSPLVLAALCNNTGTTYATLGDQNQALQYQIKALKILESVLTPHHPDVALAYNNIGLTFGKLNDHHRALEFQLSALTILEGLKSPSQSLLATVYNNVGFTYGQLGDQHNALEYFFKSVHLRELILPPQHPDLATNYNNIGTIYEILEQYDLAISYIRKALQIRESVLSSRHPGLASSYNSLGVNYGKLGDFAHALEYLLKALHIREVALVSGHPELASSYNNVGYTYGKLGKHQLALEHHLKAFQILQGIPSAQSSKMWTCDMLAVTYENLGDTLNAEKYRQMLR